MKLKVISLGPTSLMLFLSLLGPLHLRFLLELQICLWQLSISASFPLLLLPLPFPRFPSLKCWSHSLTSVSFILNSLSVAKFYRFYPLNVLYPVLPPPFFFLFAIIPIQTCTLSIGILKSILYNVDNFVWIYLLKHNSENASSLFGNPVIHCV